MFSRTLSGWRSARSSHHRIISGPVHMKRLHELNMQRTMGTAVSLARFFLPTCSFRGLATTSRLGRKLNKPPSGKDLPRSAGITSMMRLPIHPTSEELDVAFVGVPFDIGTSNRPGTRFGPRHIRMESVLIREVNKETGAAPFEALNVGDVGDLNICPYEIQRAAADIREGYSKVISNGCKALAIGGDHTITYPILQAIKDRYGPVGLIHVDAHKDTSDLINGCPIAHGTPFYRAEEDGCLDTKRVVQIGMRGSGYSLDNNMWGVDKGFRVVPACHCWHKSLVPLMAEVRQQMGDGPVYLSFDIDALDPCYAPATGTPEIGGLTIIQAMELIQGCRGLNLVGCDLVEVSPPYDTGSMTSLLAANLLFEMLCVLPGVPYYELPI